MCQFICCTVKQEINEFSQNLCGERREIKLERVALAQSLPIRVASRYYNTLTPF